MDWKLFLTVVAAVNVSIVLHIAALHAYDWLTYRNEPPRRSVPEPPSKPYGGDPAEPRDDSDRHGGPEPAGPPWCCEEGQRLNVYMCPDCDETTRAYSAAMGPEPAPELPPPSTWAEQYLREKYGAHRAHYEWRALTEAFNAGLAAKRAPMTREQATKFITDRIQTVKQGGSEWVLLDEVSACILETSSGPTIAESAVPEGWKLVPVEPTRAMCEAGWYRMQNHLGEEECWKAMLAAAPTPQGEEE